MKHLPLSLVSTSPFYSSNLPPCEFALKYCSFLFIMHLIRFISLLYSKGNKKLSPASTSLIDRVLQKKERGVVGLPREDYLTVDLLQDIARCIAGLQVIILREDADDSAQYVAADVALQPQVDGDVYLGVRPLPFKSAKIFALLWSEGVKFDILEAKQDADEEAFQAHLFKIASLFCVQKKEFEDDMKRFSSQVCYLFSLLYCECVFYFSQLLLYSFEVKCTASRRVLKIIVRVGGER
jgi:hypothetical protein